MCIEYDGEQHFNTMRLKDKNKSVLKLKETQERDEIKNLFCKEKNIILWRIHYNQYKNITNLLDKKFKKI